MRRAEGAVHGAGEQQWIEWCGCVGGGSEGLDYGGEGGCLKEGEEKGTGGPFLPLPPPITVTWISHDMVKSSKMR